MTHRYHPDPDRNMERGYPSADGQGKGDPTDAILFDDCADCEKSHLGDYDNETLANLWERMIAVEKGHMMHYRSLTEKRICGRMYDWAVVLERLGVDPWTTLQELG